MTAPTPTPPAQIQVDIDDITAQGVYTNLVLSNVTPEEVVLDFVYAQPNVPKAKVRSRVIMSPRHAKRLAGLLQVNITEYEKQFGIITDEPQKPGITLSFN
jgi:hypothetical protein